MSKPQRTLLFLAIALLFIGTAPAVALYAQGYRVDFAKRELTQTGAFYFKVQPPRAGISVDGRQVKTTEFFFGSALTKNFLPGAYRVVISKEGYASWEKELELAERQVTEAKNVVLFPANVEFRALRGFIQDVWIAPDSSKAVLLEQGGGRALLLDLNSSREEVLWSRQNRFEELQNARWDQDSKRILLKVASPEQIRYFILHPGQQTCQGRSCSLDFLGSFVENAYFAPAGNRVAVQRRLQNRSFLQEADYVAREPLSFWGSQIAASQAAGSTLFWIAEDGIVRRVSLTDRGTPEELNRVPFTLQPETPLSLSVFGDAVFLNADGVLFQYAPAEQRFLRVAENVRSLEPDSQAAKLAIAGPTELTLLYLADEQEQPRHAKGERVFLTRFAEPVSSPLWITSHHLAFHVGDVVKAAEIDDRDGLNITDLGTFQNPRIFWQAKEKTLLVLSQGTLVASQRLLE